MAQPSAPAAPGRPQPAPARVHSVWEVCRRVRGRLDGDALLADLWVRGEASNVRATPGGHVALTLKDRDAQLACLVWREDAARLPFRLHDGLALLARGRVALYEGRGQVQLYAQELRPDGLGERHLALEQLRERLAAEGLFAAERKRALPRHPQRIGVVTSLQGAALRDVLRVLARRWPLATVVVRGVRVQGEGAAVELAAAVRALNANRAAEVLVVGRGGGSLEDLWAFNEEVVVRAIAGSAIPVVSAVGHETDVTLADLVADVRAPTPSAAAALVAPDAGELAERLALQERALARRAALLLEAWGARLAALEARAALREPGRVLDGARQSLDDAMARLAAAAAERVRAAGERLARAAALLDSLSPLRVLGRGYAIASVAGKPATSVRALPPGTRASLRLADGSVGVLVEP